jgi:hypothetical protein
VNVTQGLRQLRLLALGGRCALSSALVRRRMKSFTMALSSALRSAPRACNERPSQHRVWHRRQFVTRLMLSLAHIVCWADMQHLRYTFAPSLAAALCHPTTIKQLSVAWLRTSAPWALSARGRPGLRGLARGAPAWRRQRQARGRPGWAPRSGAGTGSACPARRGW